MTLANKSGTVDYDAKRGRFIISVPIWANGRVRDIPNRRFDASKKVWTAPATRVNVRYIEENLGDAAWTRMALDKLAEVKNSVGKMIAPALPFPYHYPFKTDPMKTQRTALERAFGRSAFAFFKDMGTGKTKTFIDLASAYRISNMIETAVVICPVALRKNWQRELAIHCPFPFDVYVLNSEKPKEFEEWLNKPHDYKWLIVGVESLGISKRPYEMMLEFIRRYPKSIMGVDESSKIKNHAAIRSKRCQEAARHVPYRIVMTGTPIAKGIMDLYAQFEFLDPEILGVGDYYSFRARYAEMGGYENRQIVGYKNVDELMEIIAPFIYQVRKAEALPDLPPKMYTKRYVPMTAEQSKLYKSMAKDKMVRFDNREKAVTNSLEKALRLQQITGGFVALNHTDALTFETVVQVQQIDKTNPKVTDLLDFVEEFDGQMIIWCAWRHEIHAVCTALREVYGNEQVVELHGGIDEVQRDININEIFQKGQARFCVGHVSVGGMGHTMTAATCEFYFSNTHNSIDREQSEDRAHRKGQKNAVLYVDQVAQIDIGKGVYVDTIDGAICSALSDKKDLSEYVRGEIDRLSKSGDLDLSSIFGV